MWAPEETRHLGGAIAVGATRTVVRDEADQVSSRTDPPRPARSSGGQQRTPPRSAAVSNTPARTPAAEKQAADTADKRVAAKKAQPKAVAKKAAAKPVTKKTAPKAAVAKKAAGRKAAAKPVTKKTAPKAVAKKGAAKPVTKKAQTKAVAKKTAGRKAAAKPAGPARAVTTPGGQVWFLDVAFGSRKDAMWAGARWDPTQRRWTWHGDHLPAGLVPYAPAAYSWQSWCQDDANGGWQPAPAPSTVQLHPHQQSAADMIAAAYQARRPGFLLADDVGLGKTYSTIAAVQRLGTGLRVLVVCPLSVVSHWRRSITAMGAGDQRWCVINYDRLKTLLSEPASAQRAVRTRTKNQRRARDGRSLVDWDVVIADEAHLQRNPLSQRSQAMATVRTGAFTVWASATAGQNPLELSYLAPLLADLTGSQVSALADYEAWCISQGISVRRGPYGSWTWERNDADLAAVRTLLFDGPTPGGLRRRPTDLAGWPDMERIAWPADLDPAQRRLYDTAWDDVRNALNPTPTPPGTSRRTGPAKPDANALVALLRYRQKVSLLRVDTTADLVADLVANGRQVAVSCEFLDTVAALEAALAKRRLTTARITGAETAGDRERQRVMFQRGDVPVVAFTVCEGISLHAGEHASGASTIERATVIHDPRWSAISTAQIEGRAHRDGQRAVVYHCYAADTADERVTRVVLQRLTDLKTLVGDDTETLELLRDALER
jgi:hypothetical protein